MTKKTAYLEKTLESYENDVKNDSCDNTLFELEKIRKEYDLLKNQWNSLFEHTNDAILFFDAETKKYIKINQKAANLFGIDIKDGKKYSALDFVEPEERTKSKEQLEKLLKGKILPIYERTFIKKNGERFIGEVNNSLFVDIETGKQVIQSIIRDISLKKEYDLLKEKERIIIYEIANAAIEKTDILEFCNFVILKLLDFLEFDTGSLRVYNSEQKLLEPLAIHGIPTNLLSDITSIKLTDTKYIISEVLRTKEPIFSPDTDKEENLKKYEERLQKFGIKSLISWPILNNENELLGVIQLSSKVPKKIAHEDKTFFASIARMLAIALERFKSQKKIEKISDERKALDEIINLSPAIVFLWKNEKNFPIEYVSENIKLFGYKPNDFYIKKIKYSELIHPDDEKIILERDRVFDDKISPPNYSMYYRIKCHSGEYKWVLDNSIPQRDLSGKITHFQGIILDITDRIQQEQIIQRERSVYKTLSETITKSTSSTEFCQSIITALMEILDFERGSIRIYDQKTRILVRIASSGLEGDFKRIDDSVSIDNQNYILTLVARTRKPYFAPNTSLVEVDDNFKQLFEDFKVKSFITMPLIGTNDDLIGIFQILSSKVKEISQEDMIFFESLSVLIANAIEGFMAEEALAKSSVEKEELYNIINLSPAIVFLWENAKTRSVKYVSNNVSALGYTPEEFYSSNVRYISIIHPDDRGRIRNQIEKSSNNQMGENFYSQYRIITKSGNTKWVEDYTAVRRDSNGQIINFQGIILDITNRKRAELALHSERKAFQVVADAVAISNTLPELCQFILNGLVEAFDFDSGSVIIYNKETQMLTPIAELRVEDVAGEIRPLHIQEQNYLNTLVARTKKGVFAPDITKIKLDPNIKEKLSKRNIKSIITWPILDLNDKLLGVLQLTGLKQKDMLKEDQIVFETISGTLSNAIEKIQIDEAKRESEEKLRAITEQSLMGVLIINQKGELSFINDHVITITEFSKEDLNQINLLDFLRATQSDEIKKQLDDFFVTRIQDLPKPLIYDIELQTKSNKIKWILINLSLIKIKNETMIAALLLDITKEKEAQLILQKERKILQIISHATANNISVKNLCLEILVGIIKTLELESGTIRLKDDEHNVLNPIASFGFNEEELKLFIPISFEEITQNKKRHYDYYIRKFFVLDTLNDEILKNRDLVIEQKFKVYISWPILNAKNNFLGTLHLGSKNYSKLTKEDELFLDSINETIAISIEHIKALEKLRESEVKFKQTVNNISDGIIIIENNELVYANEQAQLIFGYTFDEIIRKKNLSFILAEVQEYEDKTIKEIFLDPKRAHETEFWFLRKDGTSRYINNRFSMTLKEDGNYSLYILSRDITEKKNVEEALRKLNEELEDRVAKRTAQLEVVNKELEAFSYSISHDLRTPLRSIDGFSQALLEDYKDKVDKTGQDYLNRVRDASKRMNALIDDILALSKTSRQEMKQEEINLSALIKEIFEELKIAEPNRKVIISIEKGMKIYGDSVLIRSAIENLLGNAWKFTRNQEIAKIKFGSKIINNEIVYYIKDNGVGFDMNYVNKLFAIFQRLHTQEEFEGTGIGLAIVQKIVNRHEGRIWVKSKIGKGATFYFTIPKR